MISLDEARKHVLGQVRDLGTERVPLLESSGRVLREEVMADRDFPPFDRVTMDGIAIAFSAYANGRKKFEIQDVAAAGAPQRTLSNENACIEVMTGAMMPLHADTVIRYEDLEIKDGMATVNVDAIRNQQNVHFKGSDRKKGSRLLLPGVRIGAPELGVMATVGMSEVLVSKLPRVLVVSSGDELVEVDEKPLPHQIRKSNVYSLIGLLDKWGIKPELVHLNDTFEVIKSKLSTLMEQFDIILMSGAVSKGKFDHLPKVLNELGVTTHFHKVRQRPGKPFWFGSTPAIVVFAFPGNPVSTFMCANYYLQFFLSRSLGIVDEVAVYAKLDQEVVFKPELSYFLEVKLTYSPHGELLAIPVKGNGSGDLANLVEADAFILLGESQTVFPKGSVHQVFRFR